MGKGRRGPTLIEVMGGAQGYKGRGSAGTVSTAPPNTPVPQAPTPLVLNPPHALHDSPPPYAPQGARGRLRAMLPSVTIDGARMVVSFSSLSAGMTVGALVVLLSLVFIGGHRLGGAGAYQQGYDAAVAFIQGRTDDEILAAKSKAPKTDIFGSVGPSPIGTRGDAADPVTKAAPSPGAASFTGAEGWIKGYTYVVVQDFRAEDQADAESAQTFLRERGVEAVVLESGGNYRYRLVGTRGFNREDPAQRKPCDDYQEQIRKLGEQFVKAGGRYELKGYQKKLTGDRW